MNLHPTRSTFQVALAGAGMVALGCAARVPAMVAFGSALVLAVAFGRAAAVLTVTRLRAAGFEMVWAGPHKVARAAVGERLSIAAELRNRGGDDVRAVALRAVASSLLEVVVTPDEVDVPAGARVRVDVTIVPLRVGRWGVHGLALEVRGTSAAGEALYEVPLMFANPFGVEALPRGLAGHLLSARGGRARRASEVGRPAALRGDGDELRELRDHSPGDPFKRIAWKASAKRGQLVVREMERDERDVVWLLVDASVEHWAGAPGRAPLDRGIDEVARLAARHLARGDLVGLVVFASRVRSWIPPSSQPAHAEKISAALVSAASMVDADRSELDEGEVARRVADHARPLDPRGLEDLPRGSLDALAARAERLRARAPFAPRLPSGRSPRDQRLRIYLAAFGIEVPPSAEGEHDRAAATLATSLEKVATHRPRPSIVHVWAPAPGDGGEVARMVRRLKRGRVDVRWTLPELLPEGLSAEAEGPLEDVPAAVHEAVRLRVIAARPRAEGLLRRMGVRVSGGPWYRPEGAGLPRAAS